MMPSRWSWMMSPSARSGREEELVVPAFLLEVKTSQHMSSAAIHMVPEIRYGIRVPKLKWTLCSMNYTSFKSEIDLSCSCTKAVTHRRSVLFRVRHDVRRVRATSPWTQEDLSCFQVVLCLSFVAADLGCYGLPRRGRTYHENLEHVMGQKQWKASTRDLLPKTRGERERERESWLSGAFGWDSSRHDDLQIEGSIDKMCLKISIVQEGWQRSLRHIIVIEQHVMCFFFACIYEQ